MASTSEDTEMKSLKQQLEALVLKVKQVEEERDRKDQEMEEIRGEQAMLQRRLSEQGMQYNVSQNSTQGISSKPPKFPSSATKASSWVKRMSLFLQAQGLGYTIQHNPNPVPVISDTDRVRLVLRHGEQTVRDHERAWCFLQKRPLMPHSKIDCWPVKHPRKHGG